jgi:hypothetical protein
MGKSPRHSPTVASEITDENSLSTQHTLHRLPLSTGWNTLYQHLQVHLQLAQSPPQSLCNPCLQVQISKVAVSWPSSVSPTSIEYSHQVELHTCSITALECICVFTRSSFSGAPRITLKHRLQPKSRYTECRCIAIYIQWYIDENTSWIHKV